VHNNTLGEVVTRVIKAKLGFNEPSITMGSCFLYEEGEGADEDLVENLTLKLSACPAGGVVNGTQLVIEDFTQNLEVSQRSNVVEVFLFRYKRISFVVHVIALSLKTFYFCVFRFAPFFDRFIFSFFGSLFCRCAWW
jgi:hypothetical protein